MWAQLHKDQGSPQEKLTLEAEYDALQPKQRQQWRRQVCEFINNNSDVNGTTTRDSQWNRRRSTVDAPSTKALIAEVLELGRMPRHSRGKPREVRLRQSLMYHNLIQRAKRELKSRSIPSVRTRLTMKTPASSPKAQSKSLRTAGRCDPHPKAELSSEMKALNAGDSSHDALDAGLPSRPAQLSEEVDSATAADESIAMTHWYLPEIEQDIFTFTQAHRRPREHSKDKQEVQLARHIRYNWITLHEETQQLLDKADDPAGVVALAQADLGRLESKGLLETQHELVRGLQAITKLPSQKSFKKLRHNNDGTLSDIWRQAGIQIAVRTSGPDSITRSGSTSGSKWGRLTPLSVLHHNYYHACHQAMETIFSDDPHPAAPKKRIYADFYAACRAPERRHLEPFPTSRATQCGSRRFKAYQCIEQLALIELVDMSVEKLPYKYHQIQNLIQVARKKETSEFKLMSQVLDSAAQRLCSYCNDSTNANEHARFLDVQGQGKLRANYTPTERQGKLRAMVQTLADAFEKENIDATFFKPNHFATLSVYYALFLGKDDAIPRNGLNRYCKGLRAYIPGAAIEAIDEKQKHLASTCMPQHYEHSGNAEPSGLRKPGRAVAAAPVTCELCHTGLSGFDTLKLHCVKKHGNLAEYRKRVFWKARERGLVELQPWVKRNMVQSFQFFRLHSVPSSCNDWTHKAMHNAKLRREEACAVVAGKDWLEARSEVRLFTESTGTTTWAKFFFARDEDDSGHADPEEEGS